MAEDYLDDGHEVLGYRPLLPRRDDRKLPCPKRESHSREQLEHLHMPVWRTT